MSKCFSTAMWRWCSARRSWRAVRSRRATCSSVKATSGASLIIKPARSAAGNRRDDGHRGSIEDDGHRGSIEIEAERSGSPLAVVGSPHFVEALSGFGIEPAVPTLRAKPALKGGNDRGLVGGTDAVADGREIGQGGGALDNADASAPAARKTGRRLRPDPDAGASKAGPVKKLARIALTVGRNVRVADDAVRRDQVAAQDVTAQLFQRRHLFRGKRVITPFVAGIDDLDPERDSIEVALPFPTRAPGVKRPPRLWNEPPDNAVLLDDIMSANPRRRIAEPVECGRGGRHPGVMQHQHVDPRRGAAAVLVRRSPVAIAGKDHREAARCAPPLASRS